MKLIKPAEISAKIMTLIDEAKKELIVVSPYNNITGWNKLINRIKEAKERGVAISWYSRKNNVDSNNAEEVTRNLGIKPVLFDDLHAKIYMNEESAIFTSMNMSKISDEKSIDLGYITTDKTEYEELYNAFLLHIKSKTAKSKINKKSVTILDKQKSYNENYLNINSNEYHVKVIHEHIYRNYGAFDYHHKREEVLEYFNFIKSGYKLELILSYTQAIKVNLYLPKSETIENIEKRSHLNNEILNLSDINELEFNYNSDTQCYVKYYFEKPFQKLKYWGIDLINEFLNDLDIIIKIVYKDSIEEETSPY